MKDLFGLLKSLAGVIVLAWFFYYAIFGAGSTRDLIIVGVLSIMVVVDTAVDNVTTEIRKGKAS